MVGEPNDIEQSVLGVVQHLAEELGVDDAGGVRLSSHLEWDVGLGSVERHELLGRLESALGRGLPSQPIFRAGTVGDLVRIAGESLGSPGPIEIRPGEPPPPPDRAQNLLEALRYQAKHQPNRPVLFMVNDCQESRRLTFPELLEEAGEVAGGLTKLGVEPGDRVGIMLPTQVGFVSSLFGVLWTGAIPVPLYPPFRLDQLEDYVVRQSSILRVAGVRHLISFPQARAVVALLRMRVPSLDKVVGLQDLKAPPPPVSSHPLALIQFTSGSTGLPKGVALTHANLLANIRAYGRAMELNRGDVTVSWLPFYHDMGLIGTLLGSIYHGQPLVLMAPQDFLARPSVWLSAIQAYRGTISAAPNFAYEICARKIPNAELVGLDLSSWRVAVNGGEAVRADTLDRFLRRFGPLGFRREALFPAYGLAEASLAVTFPPIGRGPVVERISRRLLEGKGTALRAKPGEESIPLVSCGRALSGMEVRIADEGGRPLEDHRQGAIQFQGPSAMQGYYQNPEATDLARTRSGWMDTGDLGYLAEGELFVTGRRKDIIVRAGRNLHPEDIEDAAADVPGIRRGCVAAFGFTQEEQGTEELVVVAESREQSGESRRELERTLERHLTRCIGLPPDRVVVVPTHCIPKTPGGKIRRGECRKRLASNRLNKPVSPARQALRLVVSGAGTTARALAGFPGGALRAAWCGLWLGTCLAVPQLLSLADGKTGLASVRSVCRFYLKRAGVVLHVHGEALDGPCVVVSNHASTLDPVVLSASWPALLRYLVAPWVASHPVTRVLIARLGHIPVRRGAPEAVSEQHQEMVEILKAGWALAAFPEGGFEVTPGLRPFALGAFQVAAAAGVPVVPVALARTRQTQPWPRILPERGSVEAWLGPPIRVDGSDWESVVRAARTARQWIAERCGEAPTSRRIRRRE